MVWDLKDFTFLACLFQKSSTGVWKSWVWVLECEVWVCRDLKELKRCPD